MTGGDGETEFQNSVDVSRETIQRLRIFAGLLKSWNPHARLVASSTLDQIWTRHFLDSAQLKAHATSGAGKWLDIGSGGGFPGMVLAVLDAERPSGAHFILVEANERKCAFLREVCRETEVAADIRHGRTEDLPAQNANLITARAVAPLGRLLTLASRHLADHGCCLFLKGQGCEDEIRDASQLWRFDSKQLPSRTSATGTVLRIGNLTDV